MSAVGDSAKFSSSSPSGSKSIDSNFKSDESNQYNNNNTVVIKNNHQQGHDQQQQVEIRISHESSMMAKKTPEGNTHKWSLFVNMSKKGKDMNSLIKHVVFRLHESFHNPIRLIANEPFQLSETGWGSFSLKVEIFLKSNQKFSFPYDLVLNALNEPPLSSSKSHRVILKEQPITVSQSKLASKEVVPKTVVKAKTLSTTKSKIIKAQNDAKKFNQFFGDPISNKKLSSTTEDQVPKQNPNSNQETKPKYEKQESVSPTAVKITKNKAAVSSDEENLVELQHKIQATKDNQALRNIVKCVESSGCLQKTSTSYDFDLNELNPNTLVEIRKILQS